MATEVGDLNIIQDEDLLRRMWQQTEDFSRKKEIRQRMYKLREERLKSYYITREMTASSGGNVGDSSSVVVHHKPAVSSHAESFANQGFMAMKTKEIRDSASSPTIEFHQISSTNERYRTSPSEQENAVEKSSSQQRSSSRTSKQTSSSSSSYKYSTRNSSSNNNDNDDGNVRSAQTYAITYEKDNPSESRNTSSSSYSTSSSTKQRYSSGSTRRENARSDTTTCDDSRRTIDDVRAVDGVNDRANTNGHFHTESIEYSSTTNGELDGLSRQHSDLRDGITTHTTILREHSNQPSRSVSRENSNLYRTNVAKRVSVDERQSNDDGQSTTKTVSQRTTKNTTTTTTSGGAVDDASSHYRNDLQSRSRVSVETSATHNAFASSLRASPDRSTPSPTATRQRSSSRSSVERSTPEISPRISPEKSCFSSDLSKKFTASFQNRISTSSTHLKSNSQPTNVVSSTSEYESDDSTVAHRKHGGVSTTTDEYGTSASKVTNISRTAVKSPDSSPERRSAFRPIVPVDAPSHHGRKQTDITAQTVTVTARPAQPTAKEAPASQPTRAKPDRVSPSKKIPAESSKVDEKKLDETISVCVTKNATVADGKPKKPSTESPKVSEKKLDERITVSVTKNATVPDEKPKKPSPESPKVNEKKLDERIAVSVTKNATVADGKPKKISTESSKVDEKKLDEKVAVSVTKNTTVSDGKPKKTPTESSKVDEKKLDEKITVCVTKNATVADGKPKKPSTESAKVSEKKSDERITVSVTQNATVADGKPKKIPAESSKVDKTKLDEKTTVSVTKNAAVADAKPKKIPTESPKVDKTKLDEKITVSVTKNAAVTDAKPKKIAPESPKVDKTKLDEKISVSVTKNSAVCDTKPKKIPTESQKVDETKTDEKIAVSATKNAAVDDVKPKTSSPSSSAPAGKRRSATCNTFTTPSSKGKPAKANYSSGSSESSSTESDSSDSSDDERQEVTIEEIVDEDDAESGVKVTKSESFVRQTSEVRKSTDEFIRREKDSAETTTPVRKPQPDEKPVADVKEQTQSFIQQEKLVETVQRSSAKVDEQSKKVEQKETATVVSPKEQQHVPSQCEVKPNAKVEERNKKTKLNEKKETKAPAQTQTSNKISSSDVKQQTEKHVRQEKIEKTPAKDVKVRKENKITADVDDNVCKVDKTTKHSSKSTTKDTRTTSPVKQSAPVRAKPDDKIASKSERKNSQSKVKADAAKKPTKRVSESNLKESERDTMKVRLDSAHKAKSETLIQSSADNRQPNAVESSPVTSAAQKTVVVESTRKTTDEQRSTARTTDEFSVDTAQKTSSKTVITNSTREDVTKPTITTVDDDRFCKAVDDDLIPRLADEITTPDEVEQAKREKFSPQRFEITDLDEEADGICTVSVTERKNQFLENAKADVSATGKKITVVDDNLIEQREQAVSKTKEMFENIAKNQKPHSPEFRRRLLREPIAEEAAEANGDTTQPKIDSSAPQSPTTAGNVSKIKSSIEETVETERQVRVPLMRQTSLKRGTNLIDQLDATTCVTSDSTVVELKSDETVSAPTQPKPSQPSTDTSSPQITNKPERKSSPVKEATKPTPKSSARSPSPPKKTTSAAKIEPKTSSPPSHGKQLKPKTVEITQVEIKPKKRVYEHTTIAKLDSYPAKETITVCDARKSEQKNSADTKTIAILKIKKSDSSEKMSTDSRGRKSTSPEKRRPDSGDNCKSPEKTKAVSKDRKSKSPEKRRPDSGDSRKSPEKTKPVSKDRKSKSPEKRRPDSGDSRKSPEKTKTVSKDRKSTSPEKRRPDTGDSRKSPEKTKTVSKDRKSTSPEKRRPAKDASDRRSKSPEKRPTTRVAPHSSVSPVKQTGEKVVSKLRSKFEETTVKTQFKKGSSPTKSRPSPERKTPAKSFDKTTKSETVPRKSPERVASKSSSVTEASRTVKRVSPEKTPKRSSPDKTTKSPPRSSPEKTVVTVTHTKKRSPFGVTLRNVKSTTTTTKSVSVTTTKYETETEEFEKIEEIFDLELLEKMLEKAVKYDVRSRIRAQIRLVKRQHDQLKRTSRTPSPQKSTSSETKKLSVDVTMADTSRSDGRDRVKKRLFTDDNTGSFSSSVTAATQSSSIRQMSSKTADNVRNSQKTSDSQNQSRTTYQNDYGSNDVTDSIVSSYGVGPTDRDGKLLFGLKALRTSNDSKSNVTNSSDKTNSFSCESSSRMFSVRTAMQSDSDGNVTIQKQEVKGELRSENGKEPTGTVTDTRYSYHKPSGGEPTIKTKTTTDVLDKKNEAAFKSKLGANSLIRKISNEHFESAQRKFNGEKATDVKKSAKTDDHRSGSETSSTTRYSYHESGSKPQHDVDELHFEDDDENDTSSDAKNTLRQATVSSSLKQVAKSADGQSTTTKTTATKNASKNLDSATGHEFDESIRNTGTGAFETSRTFESRSSSSSFVKTYNQNGGVSHDSFDKIVENNDARSENKTSNETSCKSGATSISLRDLEQGPKTVNSSYTVTMHSSSSVTPLKRQSSNIKRNKEINIEQIWDEDQLRNLLETCPDSELRSRIAAKLRAIMAENKNKETSAMTSTTSSKTENFSSTTKVHTSGTTSSSRRMVKANSVTSPFAKFHQLERHNSLPSSAAPIFKCTDPKLTASVTSIKDRLLNWVKAQTKEYKNIQIDNFSTSWNNGLAFCALIHHFCPHAFDYNQLTPEQRRYNFELAFRVAEEEAGIAPLLDVEDMVIMSRPDWKCVFTYVQSFYQRFRATPEAVPLDY